VIPPFCPNPACAHHHDDARSFAGHWKRSGSYATLVVGRVRRFTCTACGRGFSERTFSVDYYAKRTLDLREIHRAISQGENLAAVARHLGCSGDSVQNRIDRLARNGIVLHESILASLALGEHLVADGFESFDRSQYFPNQINILVGQRSQFLYGFTHTTIRRKSRMTPAQRRIRARLELKYKAPAGGIRASFAGLLCAIPARWDPSRMPKLALITDEHRAYPAAIAMVSALAREREAGRFIHRTYSSTAPRTVWNPLFPVNYYDRELRKDIAAYHRETTCFTRNVGNGLSRMMLYLVYHNYGKPFRVGPGDSGRDYPHAVVAGIDPAGIDLAMSRFYEDRAFLARQSVNTENGRIWMKEHQTPLKLKPDYLPKYARAG